MLIRINFLRELNSILSSIPFLKLIYFQFFRIILFHPSIYFHIGFIIDYRIIKECLLNFNFLDFFRNHIFKLPFKINIIYHTIYFS